MFFHYYSINKYNAGYVNGYTFNIVNYKNYKLILNTQLNMKQ